MDGNGSSKGIAISPRDPSTFSEGTWTLQTYITVSPITFSEGMWIPIGMEPSEISRLKIDSESL